MTRHCIRAMSARRSEGVARLASRAVLALSFVAWQTGAAQSVSLAGGPQYDAQTQGACNFSVQGATSISGGGSCLKDLGPDPSGGSYFVLTTINAFASVGGTLGANAQVSGKADRGIYVAQANANSSDIVRFTSRSGNYSSAYAYFSFFLSGTLSQSASGQLRYDVAPFGNSGFFGSLQSSGGNSPELGTLHVPIASLLSAGGFTINQYLTATVGAGASYSNQAFDEMSDFSHTAGLNQIVVRDAQGADVSFDFNMLGANGRDYSEALLPTAVPEPKSLLLLATGVAGIPCIARRRRAHRKN